jgi:hypothetical protein
VGQLLKQSDKVRHMTAKSAKRLFPCFALLKLNRRVGEEKWVLACQCESGHVGSHVSSEIAWEGDDR